jgi:hypothetical protein
MGGSVMNDVEQIKAFLLNELTKSETQHFSSTQERGSNVFTKTLVEKGLFSVSPLTEQPEAEPWLRSRLLESTVAHVGVLRYIDDLLSYDGKKPERDVRINSYLAAAHVSSSLNRLVYDALMKLKRDKRLNLAADQLDDLSRVLNPAKTFVLPELNRNFDPILVEDIRSGVQRLVWDDLSARKEHLRKPRPPALVSEDIPRDLIPLASLPNLAMKDLLDLSRQFRSFRITIKEGCLIWNFEGAPTMYIIGNKLLHSPSQSKGFTKAEIEKQAHNIARILRKIAEKGPTCSICGIDQAQELAFTKDETIIQVCRNCISAPLIWRVIYSGDPRTVR